MDLSSIIVIVGLSSAIFGIKKPLLGGIAGFIVFPVLFHIYGPGGYIYLIVVSIVGFLLGLGIGFVSHFIFSGAKGKGHNKGPSYIGGFGGGRGGAPFILGTGYFACRIVVVDPRKSMGERMAPLTADPEKSIFSPAVMV